MENNLGTWPNLIGVFTSNKNHPNTTRVATQSQIHIGRDSKNAIFALFWLNHSPNSLRKLFSFSLETVQTHAQKCLIKFVGSPLPDSWVTGAAMLLDLNIITTSQIINNMSLKF